ncbi:MAG TPA: hypothetical protein VGJ81_15365 [Thermoanaerobaculia bacterium]
MNRRHLPVSVVVALCLSAGAAVADDTPFIAALKANSAPMTLDHGKLSGPGAELLIREGTASQFFLIGEDHGGRESPQFAAAMWAALQPAGYRHIAVEAGPITAARLEALGSVDAIGKLSVQYPFALPFFNWREEAEYLTGVTGSKKVAHAVWGLDQEFVLSLSMHLDRLAQLATTPAAKEAVRRMAERNTAGDAKMRAEKNPTAVLMMTATPADFDQLAAAFPQTGEAAYVIGELRESAAIYQAWTAGRNYENNLNRSLLMKRHFRTYYDEAVRGGETKPHVMMKFGMSHMMRGRSLVEVYDIGTMLPELAAMNGTKAFSTAVLYRQGHVNEYTPFSKDDSARATEYDALKSRNVNLDVTPFFDAAAGPQWTVIDLRAIRPLLGKKMPVDPGVARIIWAFDSVVIVPEVHPSTLFE